MRDRGTNPNSSMISRPRRESCLWRFSSRLSSLASISSCIRAAAVVNRPISPAGRQPAQGDMSLACAAVADNGDVLLKEELEII